MTESSCGRTLLRSRFAITAKDALVTVDNNQRHPRGTAAVKNMIGITIDNIRGKLRFSDRLSRMDGGQ